MRIFDYTGQNKPTPSSGAAKAVTRVIGAIFGINGSQPVIDLGSAGPEKSTGYGATNDPTNSTALWRVWQDRRNTMRDINRIDREDGIVSQALDIIADHTTLFDDDNDTLRVVSSNKEVEDVIASLITRLSLDTEIWQIVRSFVKYGTYLPEIVIKDDKVAALVSPEPHEIWPATDDRGHKVPGWIYRKDTDIAGYGAVAPGKMMEEFEILPFSYGPKTGFFTMPMLGPVRMDWKRLMRLEDNMAVQRLRATDRYVHHVPISPNHTPDETRSVIDNYKTSMTKRKALDSDGNITQSDSPLDAATEIYLPKLAENGGEVKVLTPSNAHLGNLTDVYYHREKILARMGVPITYLQIMSTQKTHLTASAGLSGVDKQFAKTLRRCQNTLKAGLERLFDIELMLHGIIPVPDLYTIELPKIVTKDALNDARVALTNAQAAVYFSEAFGALPMDILSDKFLNLTTEQTATFKPFIDAYNNRVIKAKITALETAAIPKTTMLGNKDRVPGGNKNGGGNASKSLAARSSEQKGAKQSMAVEEIISMVGGLHASLLTQGVSPELIQSIDPTYMRADIASILDWGLEDELLSAV